MKRILVTTLSLCLLVFTALPASAAEAAAEQQAAVKPTGEISVDVMSNYMVKGMQQTRNSIVIQPSMTLEYNGFSTTIWGNLDTNPYQSNAWSSSTANTSSNWTETDVILSYSRSFGLVNGSVNYGYYANAASNNGLSDFRDQHEAWITTGLNVLLKPTLKVYYMFGNSMDKRLYLNLGVSHSFPLTQRVSFKLKATAGYMVGLADPDLLRTSRNRTDSQGNVLSERYNNLLDGILTASLPVKVTDHITITPSVSYSLPLSNDAKYYIKANGMTDQSFSDRESSFFYGGVNFTYSF
ncbi:MAG: hypothetical protein HPY65_05935 [Syntrophaceae bacterium]|nr:hypothetical protein [Syntrophaceae bacterium]